MKFGDYVDQVTTCDVVNIDQVDFTHIDYVFTTVPIGKQLPVPVREVTYFLDSDEAYRAREALRGTVSDVSFDPARFADPALFFPHLNMGTKDEVLDYLIGRVESLRHVSADFRKLVLQRESVLSTAFGNDVAIPHPLEVSSGDPFMCIGLLDEPVAWGEEGKTVRAVFLVSFANERQAEFRSFLDRFTDMAADAEAIAELLREQSWEAFARLVAKRRRTEQDGASEDLRP
ncbi:PTS sugar transporter subunit IIA [Collinsella vaginalis]|uniref:PTS sugar transporter subunit IIA n=1 Tax=Collinsella vaginalis TaxID=1870987 RepID=UPI001C4FA35C|nr:PTS sugar transporter subunit IIA [Collinsella vaginalis]